MAANAVPIGIDDYVLSVHIDPNPQPLADVLNKISTSISKNATILVNLISDVTELKSHVVNLQNDHDRRFSNAKEERKQIVFQVENLQKEISNLKKNSATRSEVQDETRNLWKSFKHTEEFVNEIESGNSERVQKFVKTFVESFVPKWYETVREPFWLKTVNHVTQVTEELRSDLENGIFESETRSKSSIAESQSLAYDHANHLTEDRRRDIFALEKETKSLLRETNEKLDNNHRLLSQEIGTNLEAANERFSKVEYESLALHKTLCLEASLCSELVERCQHEMMIMTTTTTTATTTGGVGTSSNRHQVSDNDDDGTCSTSFPPPPPTSISCELTLSQAATDPRCVKLHTTPHFLLLRTAIQREINDRLDYMKSEVHQDLMSEIFDLQKELKSKVGAQKLAEYLETHKDQELYHNVKQLLSKSNDLTNEKVNHAEFAEALRSKADLKSLDARPDRVETDDGFNQLHTRLDQFDHELSKLQEKTKQIDRVAYDVKHLAMHGRTADKYPSTKTAMDLLNEDIAAQMKTIMGSSSSGKKRGKKGGNTGDDDDAAGQQIVIGSGNNVGGGGVRGVAAAQTGGGGAVGGNNNSLALLGSDNDDDDDDDGGVDAAADSGGPLIVKKIEPNKNTNNTKTTTTTTSASGESLVVVAAEADKRIAVDVLNESDPFYVPPPRNKPYLTDEFQHPATTTTTAGGGGSGGLLRQQQQQQQKQAGSGRSNTNTTHPSPASKRSVGGAGTIRHKPIRPSTTGGGGGPGLFGTIITQRSIGDTIPLTQGQVDYCQAIDDSSLHGNSFDLVHQLIGVAAQSSSSESAASAFVIGGGGSGSVRRRQEYRRHHYHHSTTTTSSSSHNNSSNINIGSNYHQRAAGQSEQEDDTSISSLRALLGGGGGGGDNHRHHPNTNKNAGGAGGGPYSGLILGGTSKLSEIDLETGAVTVPETILPVEGRYTRELLQRQKEMEERFAVNIASAGARRTTTTTTTTTVGSSADTCTYGGGGGGESTVQTTMASGPGAAATGHQQQKQQNHRQQQQQQQLPPPVEKKPTRFEKNQPSLAPR